MDRTSLVIITGLTAHARARRNRGLAVGLLHPSTRTPEHPNLAASSQPASPPVRPLASPPARQPARQPAPTGRSSARPPCSAFLPPLSLSFFLSFFPSLLLSSSSSRPLFCSSSAPPLLPFSPLSSFSLLSLPRPPSPLLALSRALSLSLSLFFPPNLNFSSCPVPVAVTCRHVPWPPRRLSNLPGSRRWIRSQNSTTPSSPTPTPPRAPSSGRRC